MVSAMETFAEVLAGVNVRKFAAAVGVSTQAVYLWRKRGILPAAQHLPKIAAALGWPEPKLAKLIAAEAGRRFVAP